MMQDLDGKLITILGGSGFLGRYIAEALLDKGARLRVSGQNAANAMHIKPMANLGQVQLIAADVRNPASIARAVAGADMVVNLVGSFKNMDAVQHVGAATVAQAASAAGCKSLVHMSAIGADMLSPAQYGRSKAAGEKAILTAFPGATILRPSIVFGREDQFINRFAGLIRALPIVPVMGAGTKFQPVYVGDVAKAVVASLMKPDEFAGQILELGGPEIFTMRGLNEWIATATGRSRVFVDIPDFAARIFATVTGWVPGAPITRDQYRMLGSDNIVGAVDGLSRLGISPTPIDIVAHDWLDIYRKHGRFGHDDKAQAAV